MEESFWEALQTVLGNCEVKEDESLYDENGEFVESDGPIARALMVVDAALGAHKRRQSAEQKS